MAPYDILGNIVIMKFSRDITSSQKKIVAREFLDTHQNVTTVLEKTDRLKGRLRIPGVKYIAGVKTTEAIYKENGCIFRFDVTSSYFSPRLSTERAELARKIKKGESVLVLFGGVAPFAVVISKTGKPKKVVTIELGKIPSKYAEMNVKSNKVKVQVIQGDVRRLLPKMKEKFDRVIMTRPNLKDDFLDVSLPRVKSGGILHYYGFYSEDRLDDLKRLLITKSFEAKRKIKILNIKKAGDVGVREFRYRVDTKLIN